MPGGRISDVASERSSSYPLCLLLAPRQQYYSLVSSSYVSVCLGKGNELDDLREGYLYAWMRSSSLFEV